MEIDIVSKMAILRWARHVYLAILMCAYFAILKLISRLYENFVFRISSISRCRQWANIRSGDFTEDGQKQKEKWARSDPFTNLHDFFTYLQEVPFNTTFYKSPTVILSVNHEYNLKVKGSRRPENNIISAWLEVDLLEKPSSPTFRATPPLVFPQNEENPENPVSRHSEKTSVSGTSAEIPCWWSVLPRSR